MSSTRPREFQFTEEDFESIRKMMLERTGISLSRAKQPMVYSRLARRLRELNIDSFRAYIDRLRENVDGEFTELVAALSTNVTSFFREAHHFRCLRDQVLPELQSRSRDGICIWSAGCSTGEEPYSIAMTLCEALPTDELRRARVLATDISEAALAEAREAIYPMEEVKGLDREQLRRWFHRGAGPHEGKVRVKPEIGNMVEFRQMNLFGDWDLGVQPDVIFCRNTIIYFDREHKEKLIERFANVLTDRGYLLIGHSETLHGLSERFRLMGQTVYQKVD